jgi:hypothetical protein
MYTRTRSYRMHLRTVRLSLLLAPVGSGFAFARVNLARRSDPACPCSQDPLSSPNARAVKEEEPLEESIAGDFRSAWAWSRYVRHYPFPFPSVIRIRETDGASCPSRLFFPIGTTSLPCLSSASSFLFLPSPPRRRGGIESSSSSTYGSLPLSTCSSTRASPLSIFLPSRRNYDESR